MDLLVQEIVARMDSSTKPKQLAKLPKLYNEKNCCGSGNTVKIQVKNFLRALLLCAGKKGLVYQKSKQDYLNDFKLQNFKIDFSIPSVILSEKS